MMIVSVRLEYHGKHDRPSAETSDIRGWRRHRQECQFVWFAGRHGSGGDGEWVLMVRRRKWGTSVTRDVVLYWQRPAWAHNDSCASYFQRLALFSLHAKLVLVGESFKLTR